MIEYFPDDSYQTPDTQHRFLTDRIFSWIRWVFYLRFLRVVLHAKALALKGRYTQEAFANSSYTIFQDIEGCGGRVHIKGMDYIRKAEGPVVFVGNHMSTLEAVILPCLIAPIKPLTFIVKQKLINGRLFGPILRSLDAIAVTRKDPRKDLTDVLEQGPEKLAKGLSLVIFPQAAVRARSVIFNPAKFNSLGVKLASRAGVPVIPVALKTDFWGDGRIFRDLGTVRRNQPIYFEFGEPVTVSGRGKQEHEQITEFIVSRLKSWKVPVVEEAAPAE